MAPVQKITEQFIADSDTLEQALEHASRAHQKAFELDRITEDFSECITEDQSGCVEDFWCHFSLEDDQLADEVSTDFQISSQLIDLVRELKTATTSEESDDVSNEDVLQDLKLTVQKDMNDIPELLAELDEGELLEQALERAAQQYERSFASERLASDDSEIFHDCVDFDLPQDLLEMYYMPGIVETCQISNGLLDVVQDLRDTATTKTNDLDVLCFGSTDFQRKRELELELSMLRDMTVSMFRDMTDLPLVLPEPEPEFDEMKLTPHPKQTATTRTKSKSAVTCSLPLACFSNARVPCGGMSYGSTPKKAMSCGTPKSVTASPASAAWRAQRV